MQALKILIIDDSATSCALMERALQGEGYQVLIATDGREGLAMALQEQPHCIVLDVVLPGMNGFEVCRHLRNRSKLHDLPIIMVSTKNTSLDKSWALRQGATHYLVKPFKPDELSDLVKEALSRYAPAQFTEPAPPPRTREQPYVVNQHSPVATRAPFAPPPGKSRIVDADSGLSAGKVVSPRSTAPKPQPSAERNGRPQLHKLIPQRPEGADLLWDRSPHFLFSVDQPTRTLYEAIDGQRNIETLCEVTRMSQEEVIKVLRSLLIQHRIQICDPTGKVLHSAVLFSERI